MGGILLLVTATLILRASVTWAWRGYQNQSCERIYRMIADEKPVENQHCLTSCHDAEARYDRSGATPCSCSDVQCLVTCWLESHADPDNPRNRRLAAFVRLGESTSSCQVAVGAQGVDGVRFVQQYHPRGPIRSFQIVLPPRLFQNRPP